MVGKAVDQAITDMPDDFLIKPFLEAHRAEVKGMLLTEYNEAEAMELFREDGRKEGREEGIEIGMEKGGQKTLELVLKMQNAGDETDLSRLASDPEELGRMYKKYGIE